MSKTTDDLTTREDLERQLTLPNGGLSEEDKPLFCDAAPQTIAPYKGIWENFLNWARANSLWILGFGTGCGAIELRP